MYVYASMNMFAFYTYTSSAHGHPYIKPPYTVDQWYTEPTTFTTAAEQVAETEKDLTECLSWKRFPWTQNDAQNNLGYLPTMKGDSWPWPYQIPCQRMLRAGSFTPSWLSLARQTSLEEDITLSSASTKLQYLPALHECGVLQRLNHQLHKLLDSCKQYRPDCHLP